MDIMLWVWLGIIAISMIVEALTMDMTSIWFSVGGLCALILWAIVPTAIAWQVFVFLLITALCIVFLRKIAKRFLLRKPTLATNIDKTIGMRTVLIEPIKHNVAGSIKINGIVWTAISEDDNVEIESGTEIEVIRVEGNKMIVKPVKNAENA